MSTSSTSIALRRADLPRLSLTVKAAATVLAIVAAVALPQLFHVIGAVSGQGTMLGVAFLPMHLPIIFVGLIAGPAVGAIAGAAAPLVSFLLSGMPMLAMLPLMMCIRSDCGPAAFREVAESGEGRTCPVGRTSGTDGRHRNRRVRLRIKRFHRRHVDQRPCLGSAGSGPAVGAYSACGLLERVSYQALAAILSPHSSCSLWQRALPGEVEGGLRHVLNNV